MIADDGCCVFRETQDVADAEKMDPLEAALHGIFRPYQ